MLIGIYSIYAKTPFYRALARYAAADIHASAIATSNPGSDVPSEGADLWVG
jgi:hypothetical protein